MEQNEPGPSGLQSSGGDDRESSDGEDRKEQEVWWGRGDVETGEDEEEEEEEEGSYRMEVTGKGKGKRPKLACEFCNVVFTTKRSLLRHVQQHTTSKREDLVCRVCQRRFARSDNLFRHIRLTHDEEPNTRTPVQNGFGRDVPGATQRTTPVSFVDTETTPPVLDGEAELNDLMRRYWGSITTRLKSHPVMEILNVRLWSERDGASGESVSTRDPGMWEMLRAAWTKINSRIKINASVGAVLKHRETGEVRYYHSSSNNATIFPLPRLVMSENALRQFFDDFGDVDIQEQAFQRRPNTSWKLLFVTNVSFYLYKLLGKGKIGNGLKNASLGPMRNNRHVLSMIRNRSTNRPYNDNLCFFRCLAVKMCCPCPKTGFCVCRKPSEKKVRSLYRQYARNTRTEDVPAGDFKGVALEDMLLLEDVFSVNIVVFELKEENDDNVADVVWTTGTKRFPDTLNLNFGQGHFGYIKNLQGFAKAYACHGCGENFANSSNALRHVCKPEDLSKYRFPGGAFRPPTGIFAKLEELGIKVTDPNLLFYPYVITFDIESFMAKHLLPVATDTLTFRARHELLSISACSNVPGFGKPVCFVRSTTEAECVGRFVDYIDRIAEEAARLSELRFEDVLERVEREVERREQAEEPFEDARFSNKNVYKTRAGCSNIRERLIDHISAIPVVGYNSQRYDINVIKGSLLKAITDIDKIDFVVKRVGSMTCVQSKRFRFLDACNFIAPGFTYEKYLRAFGCSLQKGHFPHGYVTSLEQLKEAQLPPQAAFYNDLKNVALSDADYAYCQDVWRKEGMSTLEDFLRWYNNLDVVPFIEALEKQSQIYRSKGIDMLKDGISLPGLAVRWMFAVVDQDQQRVPDPLASEKQSVFLLGECNKDLYKTIKSNIVGGPSIVFCRYQEVGKTFIRNIELGSSAKLCKKVVGYDANALYLYCLKQDMPTGWPTRRREENGYASELPKNFSVAAHSWLTYTGVVTSANIQHSRNGGEVKIGQHGLPVDGFCKETNTIYQFHGCYWHGHDCAANKNRACNEVRKTPPEELFADTIAKEKYLRALGYRLCTIWECEWASQRTTCPETRSFHNKFMRKFYPKKKECALVDVVEEIRSGKFYGFVECDISVPESRLDYFSEMAPIFKNVNVDRSHLSPHMLTFAEKHGFLKRPQRMLIGSLRGERVLLLSELARWYLSKGLIISRVYQLIEYVPRSVFKPFADSVSSARRAGDLNPNLTLLAETSKLVGNSAYGKTITNKEKHRDVKYVDGARSASSKVGSARFLALNQLGEEFYEVEMAKSKLTLDTPITVGFTILQCAKLRMLEFYYDFMCTYFERSDFQYIEMDTDSAYMAISGDNLESIVKPTMLAEFYQNIHKWLPREYCPAHKQAYLKTKTELFSEWTPGQCCMATKKHDNRTPGLFKEEFVGDGIIALNPKTYFCWSNRVDKQAKFSSKGLSKSTNTLTKDAYASVLASQQSVTGVNKGFLRRDNKTYTYDQVKTGLTYFYAKRKVGEDGISTTNIDC